MTEQIYQYGKQQTPAEIVRRVTGKPLESSHLVNYLKRKYEDIYRL
ncbi:hypothetical protein [Paenibacillus sp. 598K]|nr:hypothetical protein [Paenibacillus sp. 598K]